MPGCFTFWPFSRRPAVRLTDDLEANSAAYVKHCPFCHVSKENGFNIIYEVRLHAPHHVAHLLKLSDECNALGREICGI